MRARAGSGRRSASRGIALLATGVVAVTGTAAGQEPTPSAPPAEWRQVESSEAEPGTFWFRMRGPESPPRARLGVYLQTECPDAGPPPRCDAAPVVVSVVPGGPADRAGVRAGEQLLSLDGVALESPEGEAALGELREGDEVRLVVRGTDGARRTLRLTPEAREPTGLAVFRRSDGVGSGERADVRVFHLPSAGDMQQLEVRLDSLRGSGHSFVVVSPDARGSLQIEVGGDELGAVLAGAAPPGPEPAAPAAGGSPPAPAPQVGYVVESPELARSLARVHATALQSARVRLDSLVRLRKEMSGPVVFLSEPRPGERPDAEAVRGTWTLRSAGPEVELLLATNARIAGAEFRSLTRDLAEYFRGAESGLLVLRVIPGTPADRLGLREGDVVLEAGGRPIASVDEFRAALESGNGAPVDVKWVRKGAVAEGRIELP